MTATDDLRSELAERINALPEAERRGRFAILHCRRCGQPQQPMPPAMTQVYADLGLPDPNRCVPCESYDALEAACKAGTIIGRDDYDDLIGRAGRNHMPGLLVKADTLGVIDADTLTAQVRMAWSACEFPQDWLRRADWLHLFAQAGYTVDGHRADRPPTCQAALRHPGAPGSPCRA